VLTGKRRFVDHTTGTYGRLDFAVNNAGIEGKLYGITDLPEEEWDRVLDINLKGTYMCLKYESRAMLDGGHGGGNRKCRVREFLSRISHRLGIRHFETRTGRADDKHVRGADAAKYQGQSRLPGNDRHADAPANSRGIR
jgi:NAD(P)-dependent dehydrogenase (short-subunit alcohol dehydrogenase family)